MIIDPYRFAFDPQTQGTLLAWYDASLQGQANGSVINGITDRKTGNTYPLTRNGGSVVTLETGVQNGLDCFKWSSGTATNLDGGPSASTYPYTIAAVVKIGGAGALPRTILGSNLPGGLQFRLEASPENLGLVRSQTTYIAASTSAVGNTVFRLVVCTIDLGSYAYYIDGVAAGSGTHLVPLTNGRTFRLGTSSGFETIVTGYMGETQIYSSILSAGDLAGLTNYVRAKWATP